LIKVHAAGLNPVDWKVRAGYLKDLWPMTLPIIPGWDVSGTIVEVGAHCKRLNVGDDVYSYCRPAFDMDIEDGKSEQLADNGSVAQFVAVKEWKVALKPASLSFDEAAGVPLAALTAWQGLFEHLGAVEGDRVLILNACGGVGSFAVQFAKARNITVIGTCSTKNVELVQSLGADVVIDYTEGNVVEQVRATGIIDGVYDCVGGVNTAHGIDALKDGGTIVSIGNHTVAADAAAQGKVGKGFLVRPSLEELNEISALCDSNNVKVAKVEALPLS